MLYACSAKADGVCCPMRCPMLYACAWVAICLYGFIYAFPCVCVCVHVCVCVCVCVCACVYSVCACLCLCVLCFLFCLYSTVLQVWLYKSPIKFIQMCKEWVTKTSLYRCILGMGSYWKTRVLRRNWTKGVWPS